MRRKRTVQIEDENPFSLSISDLMAALLLIFILLLAVTVINLKEQLVEQKTAFEKLQNQLFEELNTAFESKKEEWTMEIDSTLLIRFNSINADSNIAMFSWDKAGDYEVTKGQSQILNSFFPTYSRILFQDKYRNVIKEIRIEGHTDTSWGLDNVNSYFNNMELSQNRTRSILEYSLKTISNDSLKQQWLIQNITANGLSYSRLRPGFKDRPTSTEHRRVEFRIVLDAVKILSEGKSK
jgi:outer membrane protein OmpA-like peptidoglycan-associated protein